MARSIKVSAPTPALEAVAAPVTARASGFRPSPEARAAAFERGANIDAMLATLRHLLTEAVALISEILAMMPEGGMSLRTLKGKLSLAAGEIAVFGP